MQFLNQTALASQLTAGQGRQCPSSWGKACFLLLVLSANTEKWLCILATQDQPFPPMMNYLRIANSCNKQPEWLCKYYLMPSIRGKFAPILNFETFHTLIYNFFLTSDVNTKLYFHKYEFVYEYIYIYLYNIYLQPRPLLHQRYFPRCQRYIKLHSKSYPTLLYFFTIYSRYCHI